MKLIAALLSVALIVITAGAVSTAQAQDEGVVLRLTKAVDGVDPEPTGTDFAFDAPSFGGEVDIKPGGSVLLTVAGTHSFTFTELALDGWEFVSASCTGTTDVTVTGTTLQGTAQGEDVTCTFTNRPIDPTPATVTITKQITGEDPIATGTPFEFTNTANGETSTLLDGESFSLSFVPPSVTVTEVPQIGWTVTDFECDGAVQVVSSAQLQAHTIFAGPGAEVACTFTNEASAPAVVTVTKKVEGENPSNPSFNFSVVETSTPFELAEDAAVQVTLNQGTYTFAEEPLAGWQTPEITCGDAALVVAYSVTVELSGEPVNCTFVNRPDATDVLGDANCDGIVNILDAYAVSQYVVELRQGATGCPLASSTGEINLAAVSLDGAEVTILDAFRISQCVVELNNALCPAPPA